MAIVFGLIFGIICGCGIGGGSILVPLLTLFLGVEQHTAQGACLLAFLPSAICALFIHIKQGRVDFKTAKSYGLTGVVFAVLGAILVSFIRTDFLRRGFGVFLIIFAIYQGVSINKTLKNR